MTQFNSLENEDVNAAVSDGRQVRDHGPYQILIGNDALQFRPVVIEDPVPTGEQILKAGDLQPVDDYLLYQYLKSGLLELLNPAETTDLRSAGVEKFLAFKSDRSFRFFINNQAQDWGGPCISGLTLKKLANANVEHNDVYLVVVGGEDELIKDRDLFDLTRPGVEHFATAEINITIYVNTVPKVVHVHYLSYWDVVRLEFPEACSGPNSQYTVTYSRGHGDPSLKNLVDGQFLQTKQGMHINVTPTDKS
ncbi:multiubiquitin domain-containing protein [Enterobacter hormaechei]|uniref:multiubiquitin domain-containing protein n=1 Tax=Enterobacteriaceae TaxID=543 RepID=UPI0010CA2DEF|nr:MULTISPECIES: multiubiquitin domain-containing protein [Enterobacteriaceae]EKU7812200.1 multiubiquitin domain-containing protein [Klebsiella aerogenes]BBJ57555.1 hypothetical protein EAS17NKHM_009510 [Enterobacter asburiae]HDH0721097.1 multiubiquitin domain-containing protein [Klebsiella aerogenes]HEE4157900.1 multiubiquitin domain-containing protein [Klebsiella pneumoniae]